MQSKLNISYNYNIIFVIVWVAILLTCNRLADDVWLMGKTHLLHKNSVFHTVYYLKLY